MMQVFLNDLVTRFEGLEDHLNSLDAATGDGDHGTTILKGLRAAAADDSSPDRAFRKAAGGASGSLFAVVIAGLQKADAGTELGTALTEAADKIALLGQAKPGDKTMLDALVPATMEKTPADAANAAGAGREATRAMAAKRGRAKYVEGAGVGHVDAGATSIAELLDAYAQHRGRQA